MKARIYCRKHKRRHSLHAAMHCREGIKPGECARAAATKVYPFGRRERCPVWRRRKEEATA